METAWRNICKTAISGNRTKSEENYTFSRPRTTVKRNSATINYQHKPNAVECNHTYRNRAVSSCHKKPKNKLSNSLIGHDKNVSVSCEQLKFHLNVWPKSELDRLREDAKIVSYDDKVATMQAKIAEKKRLAEECERRKELLYRIDTTRAEAQEPAESISETAKDGQVKVLDRAFLAKQEQLEEVQRANRIILATKCHVIRDAQIAEKNEIERERRAEELRLEKLMMDEREKAIKAEEEKLIKEKHLTAEHVLQIKNQLRYREIARIVEAERIEEEAKQLAKAQIAMNFELMEKEKQLKEKSMSLRQELQKANELSQCFKKIEFERERISEMQIQEYMRKKRQREELIAREKRIIKEQKDRERDRLLKQQQKALETKSEKVEIMILREQEEKEREFRRKEKEAAIRRRENEKQILESRRKQQEEIKRLKAIQLAKDEAEFRNICQKLKEEEERNKNNEKVKHINREKYRSEIIAQINEQEMKRNEMKRRSQNEFNAVQEAERARERNIRNVITTKIKQMRENNIPEKFIKDVERQLKIEV